MSDFEVELKVLGEFPNYIKPQIKKNIKVVNEKINDEDNSSSESTLSIILDAESELEAEYNARKVLSEFLAFYSVSTLNHIRIIDDYKDPIKVKNLMGDRKVVSFYPTDYSLEEYDQEAFLNKILPYFSCITKKENKYLKIASEYLWRARFEQSSEIIVINCFIALEALFMRTNDNTELSYRLSNRVAVLLCEDGEKRLRLRKTIRDWYNLRSRIVHGEPTDLKRESHNDIFLITRETILRFFILAEKYQNHDEVIDLIDDAMIDNQILKKLNKESHKLIEILDLEHKKKSQLSF